MLTNEIKKGTKIVLTGGRVGEMLDSKKGITRLVKVETPWGVDDFGSVYADEILMAEVDGTLIPVELTAAHKKKMASIRGSLKAIGF